MAVAYDASSESHTGTTGSTSEASFTWTHTPVGTPKGVLVYVIQDNASTDKTTSVTYGGTTIPAVTGGFAADTTGEPRACKAFFLGVGIGTGAKSVVVNRTNDATVMYAVAITVTSAHDTEIYLPGIVLQQTDTALVEQSVDDGSTGVNSVRFAGGSFALNSFPGAGASSTGVQSIDFGTSVAQFVRRTAAGQGSLLVGYSSATVDDVAAVYLAVREAVTVITVTVIPGAVTLDTLTGLYDDIYEDIYTDGTAGGIPVTTTIPVTPGAITLAGRTPTVTSKRTFTKGKITLAGKVVVFGGTVINTIIQVTPGVLSLGGTNTWDDAVALWDDPVTQWDASANVELTTTVPVTPGAITLTGQAATIPRSISVTPGAITLSGQDIIITGFITFEVTPATLTLTGSEIALPALVPVTAGVLTLAGKAIVVNYVARVTGLGSILFTGQEVDAPDGEDDQGEDEDEDVPNISHAGGGRIASPELPGLQRERIRVGLTR